MARSPDIKDLTKKPYKRSIFWIVFLIIGLLADEYIKEGYLFDPADMTIYGTHEFLITLLSVLGVSLCLSKRFLKRRGEK